MEAKTSNLTMKLEEIDQRIEYLKKNIEKKQQLERLHENEDFKSFFLEGYFEEEGKRLFEVLVEPNSLKRDVIENIQDKLSSIRNIKQFFGVAKTNADMAPSQIEEEEAYRKEVTKYYAENPKALYDNEDGEG